MGEMADIAYQSYIELKTRPDFLTYLKDNGTLPYYGESNIGSRPDKRNKEAALTLDNLRAIPFVGSWSQLKQNVPGYYGFGAALEKLIAEGRIEEIKDLYRSSRFFQTLVGNSMQSMAQSYFPLTAFLSKDPLYGIIWNWIYEEFKRSQQRLIEIIDTRSSGTELQSNQSSIQLREDIVLPLLTIQQYALLRLKSFGNSERDQEKSKSTESLSPVRCRA
jgi:phosphoenolpyruvate carboxylase